MVARRSGSIVNTASMLGVVGMADNAAYTAAKHQRKRQLSRVARFDQFSLSGELLRGSAAGYGHAGAAGLGGCSRGRQVALPSRGSWGLRRESCVST
jgi:hypothetical protein